MPGPGRPFVKGHKGGRPKGATNKVTRAFRDAVLSAFEGMGGAEELQRWGAEEKNRPVFYQICARMIPTESVQSGPSALLPKVIVHKPASTP